MPMLLAAGSLRQVMGDILAAFRAEGGPLFDAQYGPSGKLRAEIEGGRPTDVLASASVDHVEALASHGLCEPKVFAHNELCVVAAPGVGLRSDGLLDMLADPALRLATSTPLSDPMGDYTWQFFRNADRMRPGMYATLAAKALKLSGTSDLARDAILPYITAFEQDRADAYVMYATNAVLTRNALPRLQVVQIPDELNVRSAYGIAARESSDAGTRLVRFVLSDTGRDILRLHGFQ